MAVRKHNGSVRLCANFSIGLNVALEDKNHLLPLAEDIFATIDSGTCFAELDFSESYLQVVVEPECRECLIINTHRGRYQFTRFPFEVKAPPALFQHIIGNIAIVG